VTGLVSKLPNPMKPVVTAEARILQIRNAHKGDCVGYGAAHVLKRDSKIAICSAGYADGYHRATSGCGVPLRDANAKGGFGQLGDHKVPVIGRVSMDLTAFDVTDIPENDLKNANWIELFGPNILIDDAARACGTIGYELLTGLGSRYQREVQQKRLLPSAQHSCFTGRLDLRISHPTQKHGDNDRAVKGKKIKRVSKNDQVELAN